MAKILIIDDRAINRKFLTTLLGYQHDDLREASDGAEGLRIAREQRPDLIISDVLMPTMDGYEFVRQLREDPAIGKTPVVFSTAHYLSRESQALAEKCGVTSIIHKPCEPKVVLDIVAAALSGRVEPEPPVVTEPEDFDREHLQLLTNELSEKAEQLRDAHGKLTALIELSTELARERDPAELLDRYCSVAREVIGSRWTMVALLTGDRKAIQHLGTVGIDVEDTPALRAALLAGGVFATVTKEGRAVCLSDVTSTPAELRLPDSLPLAGSLLVVPLVIRGHVDGWICLADKLGFDAFSEQDEQLAAAFAAEVAVAYDNARLYSESTKYASKLEAEISERARVDRQLSESKARLAGIIDSAMDTIITIDSDQRIVMFNKAAEKMFRCKGAEVIGQSLGRFIPPRFRPSHSKDIRRFGETGVTTRAMGALRAVSGLRADGGEFPLEASISQIEVGDQKLYTVIMRDITERKRVEEQMRLQSAALESAANAIMITDARGKIIWVNPAFYQTTGYSFEEALGENPRLLKSGKQNKAFYKQMWDTILSGKVWRNTLVNRRKDGTLSHDDLTITPILNSAGEITHFVGIKQDITEKTRAEQAQQASELRYRRLFESAKDGILILDAANGQIVDVNPFLIEMLGYSKDEFVGKELWEIGVFKDIVASKAAFIELQQQEYIRYEDLPLETRGGLVKQVEFVSNSYLAGEIRVIQCNVRDITDRKQAEEALRRSEENLRAFVTASSDVMYRMNPDWSEMRQLDGRNFIADTKEPKGTWLQEYIHPDDQPQVMTVINEAIRTRSTFQMEHRVRRVDGSFGWTFSRAIPVQDARGEVVEWFGAASDVTDRKQAEEALKETNQRLERALVELQAKRDELAGMTQQLWQASKLATMGELAASIAHELNNPLATVGLRTENLLMQMPADSEKRKPLEIIAQEVDRMATLVNNLLQFSRRSHRQVSTVDPREEVATSVEFVHYHLRSHNIEVVRDFADALPTIQADRQQLRQLFLNLLTNASDAMPQGGKLTLRAVSTNLGDAKAVAIEVEDTGEGITAENLKKIWEPFFTTKPEGKGTGLGLAICRRIVEEHGGTLEVKSGGTGRGTTVRIGLPATSAGALS